MAVAALILFGLSLCLSFGARIALQLRRTGSTGVHGLPRGAAAVEWLAAGLLIFALGAALAVPVLALLGLLEPISALDGDLAHAAGLVLALGGILLTFGAQLAMGDSWRVGVDPEERTRLVTEGPFGVVRNPIYSAMIPTVLGLALMVPSALSILALAALLGALELQVRFVEEPYLLRTHGPAYASYASRVGRFLPGVGLLRAPR